MLRCMPMSWFWRSQWSSGKTREVRITPTVHFGMLTFAVNLGKWILRYLFANLIDEEIRRDEGFRQTLNEGAAKRVVAGRAARPLAISIPPPSGFPADLSSATPRASGS